MARWEKLLVRMLHDSDPRNYTYDEAAGVLAALGFLRAPTSGSSHRKWRYRGPGGNVVVVGLVERGHGTLKPVYIREMIRQLVTHGLVPQRLRESKNVLAD